MPANRRVVVVGGGVSGLATAYYLLRDDARLDVTVLERADRAGGKVATRRLAGHDVDTGPDAVLARAGVVENLFTELGLLPEVSRPAVRRAYVWLRRGLRPLPPMSLFGVPDNPLPLVRTGILSPFGALRAAADVVLPRSRLTDDPTITELLRPRFGAQVFDRLVEPMLGGVHAGRADALSARSAVPEVYAATRDHRSTYLAMRERKPAPGAVPRPSGLGMITLRGGLRTLIEALLAAIPQARVECGCPVSAIEPATGGRGWTVLREAGDALTADAVVLATPAFVTAVLLRTLAPDAAEALEAIPYAGVATVNLAYSRADIERELDGSGFLVPPRDGRLVVGCTWSTVKWEHLVAEVAEQPGSADVVVLRCAVGRHGDTRWVSMSDAALVAAVGDELAESMGVDGPPLESFVQRWPDSMPQYTVGHADRLATVDAALAGLPGLHVTGAAYRGVGISGCVTQAEKVAGQVRARLEAQVSTP